MLAATVSAWAGVAMSFLDNAGQNLIGVGVYTVPQAATLVRLPSATVELIVGAPPTDESARAYFAYRRR